MKSLVVMTYYQMMHALALALTFDEKPNLYFCMEFLNPDESLLDRISETGVFNEVRGITKRGDFRDLVRAIRKTKDMSEEEIDEIGDSLFEQYLEPHYKDELSGADTSDEIYVYNDFQWHYYYICKHFSKIVGVEDGYGSLLQQIGIHKFKGDRERLEPFVERGYYPKPLYQHENVQKIISSVYFEELDDYYKSKLFVWDYKDIVALHEREFKKALLQIFEVGKIGIADKSVLYLGQPLDRSRYCSAIDNYLLTKKIIKNEVSQGFTVYYKPHPAERNVPDVYGGDNTIILPGDFPVEVFNYQEKQFDKLVTFGSTGASIATFAKEQKKYFEKAEFSREDVEDAIKENIQGEKLNINFYIITRELSATSYINAYSCIFRNQKIHTNIYLLINRDDDADLFTDYFDQKHLNKRIKEYKAEINGSKETLLWHKELGWMKKWLTRYEPKVSVCKVSSFQDCAIYKEVISKHKDYDYLMILDSNNPGLRLTREVQKALRTRIYPAIYFRMHTSSVNDQNKEIKLTIKQGYIGKDYCGELINKMWHRELIRRYNESSCGQRFGETIQEYDSYIRKIVGLSLYVVPDKFTAISDGTDYYKKQIEEIKSLYEDQPDYLTGQLANVVYDYYDWYSVTDGNPFAITMSDAVEQLIDDQEQQFNVYRKLTDAMLREKNLVDTLRLSQESNYYSSIIPVVNKAAETGILEGFENMGRIINRLTSLKK